MRKVWIEAALNGSWGRALQPGIPDTVEAIIAEGGACEPAQHWRARPASRRPSIV
ncbi:hypothetical protein [Bradyrhizobium paxllaeri]|uniref:hypothetical protein n=1 Tax=Bradyrhizobium paxllaeri TaxID=190148 RepID=UPI001FE3350B|nr:hypothetical protein [Bradyrhizobium paxllaeri]